MGLPVLIGMSDGTDVRRLPPFPKYKTPRGSLRLTHACDWHSIAADCAFLHAVGSRGSRSRPPGVISLSLSDVACRLVCFNARHARVLALRRARVPVQVCRPGGPTSAVSSAARFGSASGLPPRRGATFLEFGLAKRASSACAPRGPGGQNDRTISRPLAWPLLAVAGPIPFFLFSASPGPRGCNQCGVSVQA